MIDPYLREVEFCLLLQKKRTKVTKKQRMCMNLFEIMGMISPCLGTKDSSRFVSKALVEKWAAFPPFRTKMKVDLYERHFLLL